MTERKVELIEHPIRLPPPMVLRLSELRLTIMAVQIRMVGVVAIPYDRPTLNQESIDELWWTKATAH